LAFYQEPQISEIFGLASFCRKSQDSPVDPALFEFSTGAIFACFFD